MKIRHFLLAATLATASPLLTPVLAQGGGQAPVAKAFLPIEGSMPSLAGATAWINSPPLVANELRGKVVVLDIWTYTCINWLRTLPYVRAWSEKYKEQGLVVVGVHAPEFAFEHELDNVRRAVRDMRVPYPVAVDNDFAIWRALRNEYWPALYVVDAQGRLRHHHFGEGGYAQAERVIQQLLVEAGARNVGRGLVSVDAAGVEAAAGWDDLRSGENYVGYARTANFSSPGGVARDRERAYALPSKLDLNHWALAGDWTIRPGLAALGTSRGKIAYRFHARDLHLVMGPVDAGAPVRFRVLLDGKPPGRAHGFDVDDQGYGTVTQPRLYQLLRQPAPIEDRDVTIEFVDPGVQAFAFTFG